MTMNRAEVAVLPRTLQSERRIAIGGRPNFSGSVTAPNQAIPQTLLSSVPLLE